MAPARRARSWILAALSILLGGVFVAAVALARGAHLPPADFTFNNGAEISTLDPAAVTSIPEGRILRALLEGLVVRDPKTLQILPGAAASWERTPDGLTWTFLLRPEARWSNGDPVTAQDFEWTFHRVLEPATACPYASLLWCVEGAQAFNTGGGAAPTAAALAWETVGIRAVDGHTLELRLARPTAHLLDMLACVPLYPVHRRSFREVRTRFPDRWQMEWLTPENLVTNGPFTLAARRINDRIRLEKNASYWDAENVAFRSIDALAVEQWGTALNLYLTGACDWLDGGVPPELVPRLLLRDDFRPQPYLGSYFYRINVTKPPLDDVRVRRALSVSINRRVIADQLLKAGQASLNTFVPWGKIGLYESPDRGESMSDSSFELENARQAAAEARKLLTDAGYGPRGKPFPPLEIHFNTAESHRDIAELIAKNWKSTLGIEVRFVNQEWKVWLDSQQRLEYQISRSSWIADYPDAYAFLSVFQSDNPNNRTGWKNERFDAQLREAAGEMDVQRRVQLLRRAEETLLDEAPIIPIYSYVTQNLVNPRLGGFYSNQLNEQFPKYWYWKSDAELAESRAELPKNLKRSAAIGPRAGLYSPAASRERAAAK